MTQEQAIKLFKELSIKNNLVGWKFEWKKRRNPFNAAGTCHYRSKTIKLQPNFVEWNTDEEIVNTILHEIAHALMPRHGHNKFWRRKAVEIGCTGMRCYSKKVIRKK